MGWGAWASVSPQWPLCQRQQSRGGPCSGCLSLPLRGATRDGSQAGPCPVAGSALLHGAQGHTGPHRPRPPAGSPRNVPATEGLGGSGLVHSSGYIWATADVIAGLLTLLTPPAWTLCPTARHCHLRVPGRLTRPSSSSELPHHPPWWESGLSEASSSASSLPPLPLRCWHPMAPGVTSAFRGACSGCRMRECWGTRGVGWVRPQRKAAWEVLSGHF